MSLKIFSFVGVQCRSLVASAGGVRTHRFPTAAGGGGGGGRRYAHHLGWPTMEPAMPLTSGMETVSQSQSAPYQRPLGNTRPPAPPELSRNVPRPACGSVGPCSIRSCLSGQTLVARLLGTYWLRSPRHEGVSPTCAERAVSGPRAWAPAWGGGSVDMGLGCEVSPSREGGGGEGGGGGS